MQSGNCAINSAVVHIDNFLTLTAVCFVNGVLDSGDRLLFWQNVGDQEESGLHDHVDPGSQTNLFAQRDSVNNIELRLLCDQLLLYFHR